MTIITEFETVTNPKPLQPSILWVRERTYRVKPNTKMSPNRYLRRQQYKNRYRFIVDNLNAGRTVVISTAYKATSYTKKHVDMFVLAMSGVYVKRGKSEVCIDLCTIKVYE